MMGEKRFKLKENLEDVLIEDTITQSQYSIYGIVDLVNEQQELIEELHISDHMGWGKAEKFEKELKQKKIYIKRLEYKVQKFKEMNGEQQATIKQLQRICETINSLYNKINHLKEENEQLKQEVIIYKKAFQQQVQRCTL